MGDHRCRGSEDRVGGPRTRLLVEKPQTRSWVRQANVRRDRFLLMVERVRQAPLCWSWRRLHIFDNLGEVFALERLSPPEGRVALRSWTVEKC